MKRVLLLAGICPLFLVHVAAASTVQVGSCKPKLAKYPSISQALSAVPPNSTIYVCPGTYAEQLGITQPVNLLGVNFGNASGAVLTVPSGGLVANAPNSDDQSVPYAAQIAVTGGGPVTISDLTVDGTNSQIAGCSPILVGILFENTAGIVQNNRVINQMLPNGTNGLGGCQSGNAIELLGNDNEMVNVVGNDVENFQKNGITAASLTTTISGNTVTGQGPTPLIAQNGIEVDYGKATISGNSVADLVYTGSSYAATGILVYETPSVMISANSAANTQGGVYDFTADSGASDSPTITGNKIQATHIYDGIDVCGVNYAMITKNIVNGSDESAVHIDSECPNTGNSTNATVSGNRANGACAGILVGPGSSLSTSAYSNQLFNIGALLLTNSDVCPAATTGGQVQAMSRHAARHAQRAVK